MPTLIPIKTLSPCLSIYSYILLSWYSISLYRALENRMLCGSNYRMQGHFWRQWIWFVFGCKEREVIVLSHCVLSLRCVDLVACLARLWLPSQTSHRIYPSSQVALYSVVKLLGAIHSAFYMAHEIVQNNIPFLLYIEWLFHMKVHNHRGACTGVSALSLYLIAMHVHLNSPSGTEKH